MEALADSLQLLGTERAVSEEQLAGICEAWLELGYEKWHDIVGAREEALLCLGVCLRDSARLLIDAANSGNLCERSDGARVKARKVCLSQKSGNAHGIVDLLGGQKEWRSRVHEQVPGLGTSMRPAEAIKALAVAVRQGVVDPAAFLRESRLTAVLSCAPSTIASAQSALRCYAAFADTMLSANGRHLPPTVNGLVAFSRIFRHPKTYTNYLLGIKLGCIAVGIEVGHIMADPLLKRAAAAVGRRAPDSAEKRFITMPLLEMLAQVAVYEGDVTSAMLYILSYAFLLRVPSEALPLTVGECEMALAHGRHSATQVGSDGITVKLARRKNKPRGSVLCRKCWCRESQLTCPVHILGAWLEKLPSGARPFVHLGAGAALAALRRSLTVLGISSPQSYKLHDFRRGHAHHLAACGQPLHVILRAGEWRSAAFLAYLDVCELDTRAVLEAHWVDSDAES